MSGHLSFAIRILNSSSLGRMCWKLRILRLQKCRHLGENVNSKESVFRCGEEKQLGLLNDKSILSL